MRRIELCLVVLTMVFLHAHRSAAGSYSIQLEPRADGENTGPAYLQNAKAQAKGPVVQEGKVGDTLALDNAYVRIMHNAAACTSANGVDAGTRIIVALTRVTIQSSKGALTLQRGQTAVFLADESYTPPTGEFFEVAVKPNHPPVKGPEEWIEPEKNSTVYEDAQLRVFEERLAPGDTRELHSHAQRVVVRLNEVQLTDPRYNPNGTPKGGIQVPNTVRFAEPIVHVVRNLSAIPLFNVVIEFKVPN